MTPIRLLPFAGALFVALLATSVAYGAVTFSVSASSQYGGPPSALLPGEEVVLDVTLRTTGEQIYAISASATGYDPELVEFVSGTATESVLSQVCVPEVGCFGGLSNQIASSGMSESVSNPLGPQVRFLSAYTTSYSSQTGIIDPGVSGIAGDAQFQLVFRITGLGSTTIEFGTNEAYGDAVGVLDGPNGPDYVSANNATVQFVVLPEPGTAVLVGLGLSGLACRPSRWQPNPRASRPTAQLCGERGRVRGVRDST